MRSKENLLGAWGVLIGVILAVVIGVFQVTFSSESSWVYIILAVLGVIIGFASASMEGANTSTFLLASTCLVIVSAMGYTTITLPKELMTLMGTILNALLTMFVPATIIVAVKTVFSAASLK
ncbi:MAG: hypothetical protein WC796_00545 [Candidatus Pacearchaeota archaeon]|jgi:hypothetical protein